MEKTDKTNSTAKQNEMDDREKERRLALAYRIILSWPKVEQQGIDKESS